MHEYDVWLNIECKLDGTLQVVCTLFTKMAFPIRPLVGDPLTFWSARGSDVEFSIVSSLGVQAVHYASTAVDSIAHQVNPNEGQSTVTTYVSCIPVQVATTSDARRASDFLATQHRFEIDPYGINLLARPESRSGDA